MSKIQANSTGTRTIEEVTNTSVVIPHQITEEENPVGTISKERDSIIIMEGHQYQHQQQSMPKFDHNNMSLPQMPSMPNFN